LLHIKTIKTGKWLGNCYLLNNSNNNGVIIDPGNNADDIISYVENSNISIKAILNTHAHYDHIGAVQSLKETFSVPFFLHSKDLKLLKSANLYQKLFEGEDPIRIPEVEYHVDQIKNPIRLEGFSIKTIYSPGHTWGSVCYRIKDCLFSGDLLFKNNIGRIDLPGGNKQAIKNSLKKISELSHDLKVYPGHGESTSLQNELENNRSFTDLIA